MVEGRVGRHAGQSRANPPAEGERSQRGHVGERSADLTRRSARIEELVLQGSRIATERAHRLYRPETGHRNQLQLAVSQDEARLEADPDRASQEIPVAIDVANDVHGVVAEHYHSGLVPLRAEAKQGLIRSIARDAEIVDRATQELRQLIRVCIFGRHIRAKGERVAIGRYTCSLGGRWERRRSARSERVVGLVRA